MDKEAKKMNYSTDVTKTIKLTDGILTEITKKKAAASTGTWIKLNPASFALMEENNLTVVRIVKDEIGCACKGFTDADTPWMCEHLIAFKDLKNDPQASIQSSEYRWLQAYLFGIGWYSSEDRWVYPSLDTPTVEPEVVAELPPLEEEEPVIDKDEPKMIERECAHCGFVSKGYDRDEVVQRIADHRKTCPKNPANKKKSPKLVTQEAPEQPQDAVVKESLTTEKPTVAKSAPVEKPSKKDEKKNGSRMYDHPDGSEFNTAEELLDYVDTLKAEQEMNDTKALLAPATVTDTDQLWTDAQLEVMRKTVAAKATPEEFAYFLNVARYSGLNPFLKEIYFVKNEKGQTTIITGRDGYLTIAKRDLRFTGVQSMEVCETDVFKMSMYMDDDGAIHQNMTHQITNFKDRGEIIGAWARSQMQGEEPVIIYASMAEYDKSKNLLGGKVWKQYASSMIRKVVESMVLKRIAGISGLITEAEIGGNELITIEEGE